MDNVQNMLASVDPKHWVLALSIRTRCGAVYVVQAMSCKQRGAFYAVHAISMQGLKAIWCNMYVVQAMRAALDTRASV
eukprot:1843620-Pyramimonas_sp.AAC.1